MLCKLLATFALIGLVAGRAHGPVSQREDIRTRLERECQRNSRSQDAWKELDEAANKFSDCVMAELDANTLMVLYQASDDDDAELILGLARNVCSKKATLQNCFFNLMDATVPCLEPNLKDRLNDSKKAIAELGDYICSNDAEIVSKLINKNAIACTESKLQDINQCVVGLESIDTDELSVPKACQLFNEAKDCLINTMRTCPDKTHADFTQRVLDALVVGSQCENSTISVMDIGVNSI